MLNKNVTQFANDKVPLRNERGGGWGMRGEDGRDPKSFFTPQHLLIILSFVDIFRDSNLLNPKLSYNKIELGYIGQVEHLELFLSACFDTLTAL